MKYTVILQEGEESGYVAIVPALRYKMHQGMPESEAELIARRILYENAADLYSVAEASH